MTFGWGIRCTDGVVIASDSLWIYWNQPKPGGQKTYTGVRRSQPKHRWVGDRIAFVASGCFKAEPELDLGLDVPLPDWTFDEIARDLFDDLGELYNPDGIQRNAGFGVLVGGIHRGETALTYLNSDGPSLERAAVGQMVGAGGLSEWPLPGDLGNEGPGPLHSWPPYSGIVVEDAAELAAFMCYMAVRTRYARWGRTTAVDFAGIRGEHGGELPPFAFPIDVLTITEAATKVSRIDEPSPERGAEMLAEVGISFGSPTPGLADAVAHERSP